MPSVADITIGVNEPCSIFWTRSLLYALFFLSSWFRRFSWDSGSHICWRLAWIPFNVCFVLIIEQNVLKRRQKVSTVDHIRELENTANLLEDLISADLIQSREIRKKKFYENWSP